MGKTSKKVMKKDLKYDLLLALPLVLVVTIVPLIVYLKVIPVEGPSRVFTNGNDNLDFFSYYKMIWLLIFTGMGFVIYMSKLLFTNTVTIRKDKVYYPVAAYLLLAIVSTIFATHRDVALIGFVDRYEGLYAIIAYVTLFFLGFNVIDNEKQLKPIIIGLGISALVMSALGVTQFMGNDFLMTDFGKKLILPAQYEHIADELKFTFESSKHVYGTLYNINYVGVYMSFIFALFTTMFILIKEWYYKIFFLLVSASSLLMLLGSRSRAGMFSIVVYGLVSLVFFRHFLLKHWKAFVVILAISGGVFYWYNDYREGLIINSLKAGIESLKATKEYDFQDIVLDGSNATIVFDTYSLRLSYENNEITFYDENNQVLEVEFKDNIFKTLKEPYNKHTFELQRLDSLPVLKSRLTTSTGRHFVSFVIDPNSELKVLGYSLELIDDIKAPYIGFEGRESLASNRGYIWSRTLPMLKDNIVIGQGPDTYALHFPNNDYVGKMRGLNINTLVDKPHNLYMQMGINTGLLSLLSFIIIIILYVGSSFKAYFNKRNYDTFLEAIGVSILLSVLVFLFTGFSNDSLISVTPLIWLLLGVGFMINNKILPDKKISSN